MGRRNDMAISNNWGWLKRKKEPALIFDNIIKK